MGWGSFSQTSQIRIRMWTLDPNCEVTPDFIRQRISSAIARRKYIQSSGRTDSVRLIHSESDGLAGVILDLYGNVAVVQLVTNGANYWRETIIQEILGQIKPACLIEKSDADVMALEGLPVKVEVISGHIPETGIVITENGIKYQLDVMEGQKTGFYLDQRDNRALLQKYAADKRVLDCFCFSGGFSLNALASGASHVTAVDSSADAIKLVTRNAEINGFDTSRMTCIEANVFEYLRLLRDRAEQFDLIVLDPPKFAPTSAQVEKAARAYKDINLLALKILKPGGILFTFSCSGGVKMDLFQKIVADAALDAGKELNIIHYMHQASDHSVLASFPESEYLKGIVGLISG